MSYGALNRRHNMMSSLDMTGHFIMKIDTRNTISGSTASDTFEFPLDAVSYNAIIDWGDGSKSTITSSSDPDKIHTYAAGGIYTIQFYGSDIGSINVDNSTNRDEEKILEILQWGNLTLSSNYRMFRNCYNLVLDSVVDVPKNISGVLETTFGNCTSIVKINNIELWDMTNVTSLKNTFFGCSSMTETGMEDWAIGTNCTSLVGTFYGCSSMPSAVDLSGWDVSNVSNITSFIRNADNTVTWGIGNWNVSSVADMTTFARENSGFNEDLSNWNLALCSDFVGAFQLSGFNNGGNALTWTLRTGAGSINMQSMFDSNTTFNVDISSWNMSRVSNMEYAFSNTRFNNGNTLGSSGTLTFATNFSILTTLKDCFNNNFGFNCDIGAWDISTVTSLYRCFQSADEFNNGGSSNINNWNTSSTTGIGLERVFNSANAFNQDISNWDISGVTSLSSILAFTSFNHNLNAWDVAHIRDFSAMLISSNFNNGGVALTWTTTAATDMSNMFNSSSFNQTISNFDTSGVTNMRNFMSGTPFNQPVNHLDLSSVTNMTGTVFSSLSTTNYSNGLVYWGTLTLQSGVNAETIISTYTETAVDSGTTDGTTTNKLVDSTQNFITTVSVGDIIHNTTDDTYAEVLAIDSDTQLSLDNDIMTSGENYTVQSSAAAKGRYVMINTYNWTINDNGPV